MLQVRIYSSVAPGLSAKHARIHTQPMLDLVGDRVRVRFDVDLVKGETAADLRTFGEQLNTGDVHLGAIWGLEYGWLRRTNPHLRPLVVCTQTKGRYTSQFMVHGDSNLRGLADLRGKRLAMYPDLSLVDRVYIDKLLGQQGETRESYFQLIRYESPKQAISAVKEGNADCVLVNMVAWGRYIYSREELGVGLHPICPSSEFPPAVIVGRPNLINDLRSGLWQRLQEAFETAHQSPEGQQCIDFWRVERFAQADSLFEDLVEDRLQDYPITVLSGVE
jgi:ABC-type phosphate/phosphonate transport system substrate-binding protein